MRRKKLNMIGLFLMFFSLLLFFSCTTTKKGNILTEIPGLAMERPSLELAIDRLSTSGGALRLVDVIIKDMAISDTAVWPQKLNEDPVVEMAHLDLDGMYRSNCGVVLGAKKHLISLYDLLYVLPPDNKALPNDFYEPNEETIIYGRYFLVKSPDEIIKKQSYSTRELQGAVDSVKSSFFKKNRVGEIEKRAGILKGRQVTGNRYPNLLEAVYSLSPNGEAISDAFENRDAAKEKFTELTEELHELKKKGTGAENNEQTHILKERLERLEDELKQKNHILLEELDNIDNYKGSVNDPVSVRVLMNVSTACQGTSVLLDNAVILAGAAVVKMGQWLNEGLSLSDEVAWIRNPYEKNPCPEWSNIFNKTIERMKNLAPGSSNFGNNGNQIQSAEDYYRIYIPLRISRIQANFFNSLYSLRALKMMFSEDLKLIKKIDEKANLLINPDIAAKIENTTETTPSIPVRPAAVKVDPVREIQQILTTLGYEPGPIDGQFGRRTAQAIVQFQNDFGYPENRRATIEFLRTATYAHDLQSKGVDIKSNPQRIRQFFKKVQETLKRLGYYSGGIDGRPGQGTCAAVNSFLDQCSISGSCHISIHDLEQIRQMGDLCRFEE